MSAPHVLLEREKELDLLAGVLEDVEAFGGRVVLIRGEAGIGKTALVRGFLERYGEKAHVLFGRCDDLVTPRPLAPFWDMARHESLLRDPLQAEDRWGLTEAILDLLERSLRPTIAVIEDTHWADEATLDVVSYLGRRIGDTYGLLVLTYRDGEVDFDHPLRRVMGALSPDRVVRMRLGGLSKTAVSSLLADSYLDLERVYTATDGNPFLVTEMAAGSPDAVPSSVQDSVMARVKRMSPPAREMLNLLSVIPKSVSKEELQRLIREDVDQSIAECVQRGLLDVGNESIGFRHELLRQAVENSLTANERIALNQTVLNALPQDADPARLAHHAREAHNVESILSHTPAAALAASAVGSHREAVDHFRQLEPYLDHLAPDVRASLLEDWARTELTAGYWTEASTHVEKALRLYREIGDRAAEARTLVRAAYYHKYAGERDAAERYARQAIEVLGTNPDGRELARALEVNAFFAMQAGDVTATLELVERTLEAAGPGIDERILVRCLNHRGAALDMAHYPDGLETLNEARRHARAAGLWEEEGRALVNHASMTAEVRDLFNAEDYALANLDVLSGHEESGSWRHSSLVYATVLELKGEWGKAENIARELTGGKGFDVIEALALVGKVEARQGRNTARHTLNRAWVLAVDTGEYDGLSRAADALAEYAWISGADDMPVSEVKEIAEEGLRLGRAWSAGLIVLWLWKLGELSAAPEGIAEPYRLIIEGQALAAAQEWDEIGCPYEKAIALSHGDTETQLDALDILESLEATAVAAKLRQELRDRGVSVPRGRARETREHPVGLTARQAEVLDLLAEDLSNVDIADRLFLSPRTVEHHVAAVLSKLNVSTRDEAVASAVDQGLLASR